MLTFGAPWFLAGLAGLLAPLLIHLINKERATPLRFPSVRFITRSALPQRGRRSPRDWLLLLLRLLFFAAVVIALAQPRWVEPGVAGAVEEPNESVIFVVDSSASMSAQGAWERAEAIIDEALDSVSQRTPIGWVFFANGALAAQAPAPGQKPDLDELLPVITGSNPSVALREALSFVPEGESARLIILSDFQAGDWSRSDWPVLPQGIELDFQPIHKEAPDNVGVVSAEVFPAPGNQLRVIARVRNFSDEAITATLSLGNLASEEMTLAPGELRPVAFLVERGRPVPSMLILTTPEGQDDYALDNTYALWLDAPPPLTVGLVLPAAEEPQKLVEADFVANALMADAETGHRSFQIVPLQPDMTPAGGPQPEIIYLAGAGGYLEPGQLNALKGFVEDGGTLLVTPSQAGSRQQARLRESGLTDVAYLGQPGRHGDRARTYRIGSLNERSFLGRLFDEETSRDLYLAEIFEYVKLRPSDEATVLIATEEGDPVLIEERLGKGLVLTSAIGLDTEWSDLPLRNSFLPLLREALADSASGSDPVLRLSPGELPGETAPRAFLDAEGHPVEVNVSRAESDFTPVSLSSLRAALTGGRGSQAETESVAPDSESGKSLWPWFALAALVIFILESTLAGVRPAAPKLRHA